MLQKFYRYVIIQNVMERSITIFILVTSILCFASCSEEPYIGDEGRDSYFPHMDKAMWEYLIDDFSAENTYLTIYLDGVSHHQTQGTLQVCLLYLDYQFYDKIYLLANEHEVTTYKYLNTEEESMKLIDYPLTLGKTWSWGEYFAEVTSLTETLHTPKGDFENCAVIRYYQNGVWSQAFCFAKGVGIVRFLIENDDYKLTNYILP